MSATEAVDPRMIPVRSNQKLEKLYLQLSCLTFITEKGHQGAYTVCARQMAV